MALTLMPPAGLADPAAVLALVAAIVAGSSTVAALAGFGGNLLALPLLAWVCGDVHQAVFLVLSLGTVQSVLMAAGGARRVQWRPLGSMLGWSAAGVPAGFLLASRLPRQPLMVLMGLVILAGGIAGFAGAARDPKPRPFRAVDRALLLAAGVVHGAFGCGGPTVVLAARHALPEKESFRVTLFVFWVFLNGLALAGTLPHLAGPGPAWGLAAFGVPFMLLGSWAGHRLSGRLTQRRFGELVAILLAAAGIATIARAL